MALPRIFLKPGKEGPVQRFHPWVFSGAIHRQEGHLADGDLVEVYSRREELLGVGHFHKGSIAVRLLAFGPADPSSILFWKQKFQAACNLRQTAGLLHAADTNCFRLIHGEGDGLSGLIVDIYDRTAVIQCHSIGMHRQRTLIAEAIRSVLPDTVRAVYDKSKEALPGKYAETIENGYLLSPDDAIPDGLVREHGAQFRVNWETGQKTGFFLDQRENRQLLAHYARGKSVLNAFCYTGGFSCYALRAGASMVHSVDSSEKAMALTAENVDLNAPFPGQHEGFTEDVLHFLKARETPYDLMIIDPPAFAKSMDKRHNAVQGYKRLNEAALKRVAPGGVLFTFSCSQVVDRDLFYHTIAAAAMEVKRPVQVLHHLSQGADHPVSLFHPEGAYLKGLVLYVE